MSNVSFFTPIIYRNNSKNFLYNFAEFYLNLDGKRSAVPIAAYLQNNRQGVLYVEEPASLITTTLKIVSYIVIILPLLALIIKAVYRKQHTFYVIDSTQELGRGIDLNETQRQRIIDVAQECLQNRPPQQLPGRNTVFTISEPAALQRYVFKIDRSDHTRINGLIAGWKICNIHGLDRLRVPRARELAIPNTRFTIVVEEKLQFSPIEDQEDKYLQIDRVAIAQLTRFIIHSGFNDMAYRNAPILDGHPENMQIGLFDLEECTDARTGLWGNNNRDGLAECIRNPEHLSYMQEVVIREAPQLMCDDSKLRMLRNRVNQESVFCTDLQRFNAQFGSTPRQVIAVPDAVLQNVSAEKNGVCVWLERDQRIDESNISQRDILIRLVNAINEKLRQAPEGTVRSIRTIKFPENSLFHYSSTGRALGFEYGAHQEENGAEHREMREIRREQYWGYWALKLLKDANIIHAFYQDERRQIIVHV